MTLVDQLLAAKTIEELDELALAKEGYWTPQERLAYERRVKWLKAWDDDRDAELRPSWGGWA